MTSLRQPGTLGMLLSLVPAGLALTQPFALARIFHRRGRRNSRKARYYWCSRQF